MNNKEYQLLNVHIETIESAILGSFNRCADLGLFSGVTSSSSSYGILNVLNEGVRNLILEKRMAVGSQWEWKKEKKLEGLPYYVTFTYKFLFEWGEFYQIKVEGDVTSDSEDNLYTAVNESVARLVAKINTKSWQLK